MPASGAEAAMVFARRSVLDAEELYESRCFFGATALMVVTSESLTSLYGVSQAEASELLMTAWADSLVTGIEVELL